MKNLFTRTFLATAIFGMALTLASCNKELSGDFNNPDIPDFVTKVNSSVSGFVTDQNDEAVVNASVLVGTTTVMTDEYGYFEAENVQVVKSAATVTVNVPGYFKGIKTYIAENNKAAFFRIKLIPKLNSGTVSGTTGGVVTLTNGMTINFPASAIVNDANGAAYTGTVNVAAHWIDPTSADLSSTMPGDLRGVNSNGSLRLLTTYGMAAVELTGTGGEDLQIAAGKKATLTMPIPASILASAPATIPLWHFDEAKGLWIEEGSATKTGNTYVGEVSHFSFWNCDVPNTYVQANLTLHDVNGNPVSYGIVRISEAGNPNNTAYGWTDASGYVSGAVPDNASLILEVLNYACGNTPLYTQTFTTTNVNVSLGTIVLPATSLSTISGNALNCTGVAVQDGYIIMQRGYSYFRHELVNGAFSFSTPFCSSVSNDAVFIAEDITGMQQSVPLNYTLTSGANAIGTLTACGVNTQEFVNYSYDGTPHVFTAPGDSIQMWGQGTSTGATIMAARNNDIIQFKLDLVGIATGSSQAMLTLEASAMQGVTLNSIMVNITEYGAVNEFMAGNWSGTVTGPTGTKPFTGNFRVRRSF